MTERRGGGSIFGGIILIGIGFWFLLDNMGFDLPGVAELWPLFPILGGLALLFNYLMGSEKDAGVLIPGCGGFMAGVFFLAITLGPLDWEDLQHWWPIFPVIGGIAFISMFAVGKERNAGLLVPGCGGLMVGLFFFLFTLGTFTWHDMGRMWPGFPLIGGLTFLAVWAVNRREVGLLVPAGLGLALGLVGYAFTLAGLGLRWLAHIWPFVLIVLGLILVGQSLLGRRRA